MNTSRIRRTLVAVSALALLPMGVAACSSDSGGGEKASDKEKSAPKDSEPKKPEAASGEFGSACAAVPKTGKGSFKGMAQDPVATAASNNPELSTLVSAVKKAGLVDTLNSSKDITVFAPTNAAFDKIPKADLEKVLADKKTLTKILTYHVVGEPLDKAKLADGSYPTLAKEELTTSGSGDSYKVNGKAAVGCGDVKTANATVHIVDSVLMPPK
ncbi:Uncaracterized surface protein containing fasciclin (FAS1) repeats [Streptomyces sp. WMMB 714]|uniref:fasciclin domain-containing protein n=1 Tax=Streptomyces sp. WMMB 714 TaxID=1286822 RepID=UPI0005F88082|nr:fasciclin domain-containing protein [Streptomyces sp. WMMB 714]SCK34316.1 Uncaracterized surface protein containing fasciclin (FAS1) repeats [Streptomyces sp. WMMB 714]